jgi:hypothetical protein
MADVSDQTTDDDYYSSCRRYNGFAHEPESQFAKPMEQQLLRLWPRTMLADAITTDEKRILDQWINFTLKTQGGSWFADPGQY